VHAFAGAEMSFVGKSDGFGLNVQFKQITGRIVDNVEICY